MGRICQVAVIFLITDFFLWHTQGFGFGGGRFSFPAPPLGPVFLSPVNSSARWADLMEDAMLHALDHCKSVRMCDTSGLDTFYDSECSECHPCSCEETCYLRGDCCIDKLLRDVSDQTVLDTAPLQAPVMGCHSTYITPHEMASHSFMVDRCPASFKDRAVVETCLNPSPNETYSQWPVWSPSKVTVYRNADCALCHGEDLDQLVRWNLKVECDRSIHLGNMDSADIVIEEALKEPTCHVSFVAPEGSDAYPCRPVQGKLIDSCNATGQRFSYDQTLWKACEVFQGEVTFDGYTYKNVFCAMCNNEMIEAPGTCEEELPVPFFVVLNGTNFQLATKDETAKEPCRCEDSEVFDKYQRKCRQLQCSMTRTIQDRECRPTVINSTGLFYDVGIHLKPLGPQHVLLRGKSSLTQVARNIRTSFMLQGSTTSGWDVRTSQFRVIVRTERVVHGNASNSQELHVLGFKVHIRFCSMWPEPSETLETRLFALMNSLWNISVDGRPKRSFAASPLYIRAEKKNDTEFYQLVTLLSSEGDISEFVVDIPDPYIQGYGAEMLQTNYYLRLSDALTCPRVSFDLSKEAESGNVQLRVNKTSGSVRHLPSNKLISFEFVELGDDGEVMICADQLFDTVETTVTPVAFENTWSVEEFVMLVTSQALSALCLFLVIVVYIVFPELRTLPGKNSMGLVCTLLLAIVMFGLGRVGEVEPSTRCVALGVTAHFFLLSAFTWITICIVHTFCTVRHMLESHLDVHDNSSKVYIKYMAISLVCPAAVVVLTILGNIAAHSSECGTDRGYGFGICFLSNSWSVILGAMLPIGVVLIVTLSLYWRTARDLARVTGERKHSYRPHYRQFVIYVVISTLMGVTWLVGLLALLLSMQVLNYIFVVLYSVLAIFILVVFVCRKKMLKLCQTHFFQCCLRERKLKTEHKFTPVET